MGMFQTAMQLGSRSGRKLRSREYTQQKRIAEAQIQNIKGGIEFREKEDPRERALQNQSMFARGLGKSTIATQDRERLIGIQARRMAALKSQLDIAEHGYQLIRRRQRYARRQRHMQSLDAVLGVLGGATAGYLTGGATGAAVGAIGGANSMGGGDTGMYGY